MSFMTRYNIINFKTTEEKRIVMLKPLEILRKEVKFLIFHHTYK